MSPDVVVRGNASAEELAVVLAVMAGSDSRAAPRDPYAEWRKTRLAALRSTGARTAVGPTRG